MGLREDKKQATRDALSWAALNLALERGIGNVLVEEIAGRAGVSPRTFNNYFSSKYEAIAFRHLNRIVQAADALRALPAGEPLWPAITSVVLAQFGDESAAAPDAAWTRRVQVMTADPEFVGAYLRAFTLGEKAIAGAVAERTGADADELHPRLVAAAVSAAIRIASDEWTRADPPIPLVPLLRSALTQIAAGLPG